MNGSLEIVNVATAAYQYVIDVSRPPGNGIASDMVSNILEVGAADFKITKSVCPHNPFLGEPFEYNIQVQNIGNSSGTILLIDQFDKNINIINIYIDGNQYSTIDDINTGIQLGPILPGDTVTVLIKANIFSSSTNCICNRAYGLVEDNNEYIRYKSNQVCFKLLDKHCCPVNYRLCILNCSNDIQDIINIQQRMLSYEYFVNNCKLIINGCIGLDIEYEDCCGNIVNKYIESNVNMCIPINNILFDMIKKLQFCCLNLIQRRICNRRLIIDSQATIKIIKDL